VQHDSFIATVRQLCSCVFVVAGEEQASPQSPICQLYAAATYYPPSSQPTARPSGRPTPGLGQLTLSPTSAPSVVSTAVNRSCAGGLYLSISWSPSDEETRSCAACPSGKFSPADSDFCTPCDPGHYSFAMAEACEPCPAGFMSLKGASKCRECAAGTVSNATAATCTRWQVLYWPLFYPALTYTYLTLPLTLFLTLFPLPTPLPVPFPKHKP